MKQLSREEAIAMAEEELYKHLSLRERAEYQLSQELLCMPFTVFHEAVDKTARRPVFTHEFASSMVERVKKEILGDKEPQEPQAIIDWLAKRA